VLRSWAQSGSVYDRLPEFRLGAALFARTQRRDEVGSTHNIRYRTGVEQSMLFATCWLDLVSVPRHAAVETHWHVEAW